MLLDKSFWAFVLTTGRVPRPAAAQRVGDVTTPYALKVLSSVVVTPGQDVVNPEEITAYVEANKLRSRDVNRVLNMPNLSGVQLPTVASAVPNAAIVPAHQAAASFLGGSNGL